MNKLPKWAVFPFVLCFAGFGHSETRQIRIKVSFEDRREAAVLERLRIPGDFRTGGRASGIALLSAMPEDLRRLDAAGFRYEVLSPSASSSVTPQDVIAEMDRLVAAYPALCSKHVFGKSVQGVELSALKISDNVGQDEPEPQILFDAGIHGNEFVGTDMVLRFAGDLLAGYAGNPAIANLINNREIWIYCMVNPDGREKTRTNANNVDLNRDWGYMKVQGFTQPETRAVRNCLLTNQFSIHFSYHSGAEYVLYPWCFSPSATSDKAIHVLLSDLYSTTSGYYDKTKNLQSYADYPTDGETIDYSYGTAGTAAMTVEITTEQGGTLQQKYYDANKPSMLKMIEYAGYGLQGTVTDAKTGQGVAATIFVNGFYPFYSNPQLGDYHKFVPAGTYSLKVVANGYLSKTVTGVIAQNAAATRTDVQLDPDPAAQTTFAYKVVYAEAGAGITPNVLGKPDNQTFSGIVALDMQYPVARQTGNEFKVHVTGTTTRYTCSAASTVDGPWTVLGTATSTSEFKLPISVSTAVQYVKIEGGAALDAVEVLTPPVSIAAIPARKNLNPPMFPGNLRHRGFFLDGTTPGQVQIFDLRGRLLWQSRPPALPEK